ncbi:MAG: hypothetical protein KGL46_03845 [Hyphomicrobiales bacterium]|nr:hypothetical protein [Hyphomicrobiales bacterium]
MNHPIPSLELILQRTAEAFGVTVHEMRGYGETAHRARAAYASLARSIAGASSLAIAMKLGREPRWTDDLCRNAEAIRAAHPEFTAQLVELEIELLAECGVADQLEYQLPVDIDPHDIARRVLNDPRGVAGGLGTAHVTALAAAFQTLAAERRRSEEPPAPVATVRMFRAFVAAEQALGAALYTVGEKHARQRRDKAFADLCKSLEVSNAA